MRNEYADDDLDAILASKSELQNDFDDELRAYEKRDKYREELARQKVAEERAREQAAQGLLPHWPEPVFGVPNGFLRSALFGVFAKGRRQYLNKQKLAALEGVEVHYTGERLSQDDLGTYLSLVQLVREQALGDQCRVTSYTLLKTMGKTDTGKNREILRECLTRLRAGTVGIKQGHYYYIGGLINEAFKDEQTQAWVVVLNPKLFGLFAPNQFTYVQRSVRRTLAGKPLAQWLHGFYSTHAQPYSLRMDTLLKLSGIEGGDPYRARQTLRKALNDVAAACKEHGQPFNFNVEDGRVHVNKKRESQKERKR
jgi:hypothetical protein